MNLNTICEKTVAGKRLQIIEVPICDAKKVCIEKHYSHSWNDAFGTFNYGICLPERPGVLFGVAVFGRLKVPHSVFSLFDTSDLNACFELNRLWVSDELGRNTESFFISKCINDIKKRCPGALAIQSFSDGRLGCGKVYQASNFKYFGCHETKFVKYPCEKSKTGFKIIHAQTITNPASCRGFLECHSHLEKGDMSAFIVKTYRYVFFLHKDAESRFALKSEPFPRYSIGQTEIPTDNLCSPNAAACAYAMRLSIPDKDAENLFSKEQAKAYAASRFENKEEFRIGLEMAFCNEHVQKVFNRNGFFPKRASLYV